jgi:hypothetical protein
VIIKAIKIEPQIAGKIFRKHNVLSQEILDVLRDDCPIFRKVGGNQILTIGLSKSRYLTIFFSFEEGEAEIQTAYPSDNKQIKFYKKVRP